MSSGPYKKEYLHAGAKKMYCQVEKARKALFDGSEKARIVL